jgi:hypothetical protein
MYTHVLGLTISALILAYGAGDAIAQDRMAPQSDQQQTQSHPMGEGGAGTMRQGGMMGGGMMGHGMMGGGAIGRNNLIAGVSGGSRTNFQGNGRQQRWPA